MIVYFLKIQNWEGGIMTIWNKKYLPTLKYLMFFSPVVCQCTKTVVSQNRCCTSELKGPPVLYSGFIQFFALTALRRYPTLNPSLGSQPLSLTSLSVVSVTWLSAVIGHLAFRRCRSIGSQPLSVTLLSAVI